MSDPRKTRTEPDELTDEELERQDGEHLPDREAMTLINPGIHGPLPPIPVDPGVGGEDTAAGHIVPQPGPEPG